MKVLTSRWKMLLYACSAVGLNLLNLVVGSYLCSALLASGFEDVTVIPFHTFLGKDIVVASAWGVFYVVAKVIDGIIDIPVEVKYSLMPPKKSCKPKVRKK